MEEIFDVFYTKEPTAAKSGANNASCASGANSENNTSGVNNAKGDVFARGEGIKSDSFERESVEEENVKDGAAENGGATEGGAAADSGEKGAETNREAKNGANQNVADKKGATGDGAKADGSVMISAEEAKEYCAYRRKKAADEVNATFKRAVLRAEETDFLYDAELKKLALSAKNLSATAVRVPLGRLAALKGWLQGSGVKADVLVGRGGETTAKVKRYETKRAVGGGAERITLHISPVAVRAGKFAEIKREVKKVKKAAKKIPLTVALPDSDAAYVSESVLLSIGKILAEQGGGCLSIPFRRGIGALCLKLQGTCVAEITGVCTAEEYEEAAKNTAAIVCPVRAEEIRRKLLKDADEKVLALFGNGG